MTTTFAHDQIAQIFETGIYGGKAINDALELVAELMDEVSPDDLSNPENMPALQSHLMDAKRAWIYGNTTKIITSMRKARQAFSAI